MLGAVGIVGTPGMVGTRGIDGTVGAVGRPAFIMLAPGKLFPSLAKFPAPGILGICGCMGNGKGRSSGIFSGETTAGGVIKDSGAAVRLQGRRRSHGAILACSRLQGYKGGARVGAGPKVGRSSGVTSGINGRSGKSAGGGGGGSGGARGAAGGGGGSGGGAAGSCGYVGGGGGPPGKACVIRLLKACRCPFTAAQLQVHGSGPGGHSKRPFLLCFVSTSTACTWPRTPRTRTRAQVRMALFILGGKMASLISLLP